jgi:tetratricopeptide (TPR) repeat protein
MNKRRDPNVTTDPPSARGDSPRAPKPSAPPASPPGYELLEEIGQGGMGVVYRARDVTLDRDVAVKVLAQRYPGDSPLSQRFVSEARITGQLQHPSIPAVHLVGSLADGRPFLAMKLIKGSTLETLLKQRTDPSADRGRLLAIFEAICQAVGYAHAHRVIHRDLKPANVMVGAFGEVQVMDWGLAKALGEKAPASAEALAAEQTRAWTEIHATPEAGSHTQAGSLIGTPAFIAPEQALGELDKVNERSDVFGLGALLAVILTGQPPYVGETAEAVRVQAARGKLEHCFTRLDASGAEPELVALCKRCLAFEPADRPANAAVMAAAVAGLRSAADERARRAELAKAEAKAKAVEEVKRRRLTLLLAGTLLLALTLGGGGWLYVKNERDAQRTRLTRDVTDALTQATLLREQAKSAPTGGTALFAQAREQVQRALALVETGPAEATLAAQVRQLQAELDEEERDRKLLTALDAANMAQAETLSENRFAVERAVPKYREAFRAYGLPAGEGAPADVAARIRQRPAAVREAIVAALDEWEYIAGDVKYHIDEPHREWLQGVLDAIAPDDAWSGQVRKASRETDPAKRQAALAELVKSADVAKAPTWTLIRLSVELSPPQAAELLRRAQQLFPADFWVNEALGNALVNSPREALELLRRAEHSHKLEKALDKVQPPEWHEAVRFLTVAVALRPDSAGARLNLGIALSLTRRRDEAIASYRKAVELNPKYVVAHVQLGTVLTLRGQVDEAIIHFQKAMELDPKDSSASYGYAETQNILGSALHSNGQVDAAIARFKKAIELDSNYAPAHYNLGRAQRDKGQIDTAIASYRKTIQLEPNYLNAHLALGGIFCDVKHDYDAAIASFREAVKLAPNDAGAHYCLGNAQVGKRQWDAAIVSYKTSIELNPNDASVHTNLGNALRDKGQVDAAIASYKRAIELDPKHFTAHRGLGFTLLEYKHDYDGAIPSLLQAAQLNPTDDSSRTALAKARAAVKLPAYLKGDFQPTTREEYLALIECCTVKQLFRAVAGLYAGAFAADPKLAEDLSTQNRNTAACYAALAAAGSGKDAAKLDDKERGHLRQQALDWLRADLVLRIKQIENGTPADRAAAQLQMKNVQRNGALASLRDPALLAKLPPEQRAAWEKFWADVAALLKKAETPAGTEGK